MIEPFRFIAPMPGLRPDLAAWRSDVAALEDLGYSTVAISDHVSRGWSMEPFAALMAAADATTSLRVLSMVLANDYRHPALVHRAFATIDVLSGGRVELGIGAGWLADDYRALGLKLDAPGTRIERLEEAVGLLKRLFAATSPVSFAGRHYTVTEMEPLPKPVQQPRPPILLGGGGRAILGLAGREADIVGINARLGGAGSGNAGGRAAGIAGLTARAAEEKVGWVRAAARAAGRADEPILQVSVLEAHVTDSPSAARSIIARLADDTGLDGSDVEGSPAVLVGSAEHCADVLIERRSRFGFSYVKLGPDAAAAAAIVARLAGT